MDRSSIQQPLVYFKQVTTESCEALLKMRNTFVEKGILLNDRLIDLASHVTWFSSLDQKKNKFFYVHRINDDALVGYINCNQLATVCEMGVPPSAELGIFILDEVKELMLPFHVMLMLLDLAFLQDQLNSLFAIFRTENVRALRFNGAFGFHDIEKTSTSVIRRLDRQQYLEERKSLFLKFKVT